MKTISPLAEMVNHPQDVVDRKEAKAFGVVVHTTGTGVLERSKKLGISPLECAISIYTTPGANFAHYCIDHDGMIVQVADEKEKAPHAGIGKADRALYKSGEWRTKVSRTVLDLWWRRWPDFSSPLSFFPGRSVNEVYLGIELIPLSDRTFSEEQYDALGRLLIDMSTRHGFGLWSTRVVGHEDLEPLSRWDNKGGWDPGALRASPRFSWQEIIDRIEYDEMGGPVG